MFEFLSNLGANAANGMGNVLGGLKSEGEDIGRQMDLAVSDPMSVFSATTGLDHLKALTKSPEEYKKFLADNPSALSGRAAPLPAMPDSFFQPVPFAPTGGFVNQMPNYLNNAQQSLRGPYG